MMKKILKPLMTVMFLLSFCASGYAINPYLQGDINDDDRVSIDDLTALIGALLRGSTSEFDGYGDVNCDGRVDITDVTYLLNILLGVVPANENIVTVSLPEGSPVTMDEVVVMSYGSEISSRMSRSQMRQAGRGTYTTDANSISVLNRDGKLIYQSFISLDMNNSQRSVTVDALETAYTMLVQMFPNIFDATPDYIYSRLKNLLAELSETQALAAAIDRSIINHGYLEMSDVESEYSAAVNKVIDELGLRDNFLSGTPRGAATLKALDAPTIPNGEYGCWGLKLRMNNSVWIPYGPSGNGSVFSYNALWHCNMTAYNSNRFAYTGWTRGYRDGNGIAHLYSNDAADVLENILKPQRVSTYMKNFTTWSGLKGYFSDSWKLLTDPDFGFSDMTWDMTKITFDMDFTTPRDVVCVCCTDQEAILYYNLVRMLFDPIAKELCKNITKTSKEEGDFFAIFCDELIKDTDYAARFSVIWQSNWSTGKKAKALYELTFPKFKTSLLNYVKTRIDLWAKDRCIEIFGFVSVGKLETSLETVTKNMNKYLKIVEIVGDALLCTLSLFENESEYYTLDLDFQYEPQSETFTVNGVTFKMILVEGGTFTMGATPEQGDDPAEDEYPAHQVTLSSFSIGEMEVTQALWLAVMGSNPSQFQGDLNRPVERVTWNDCQAFTAKLNEMTGRNFRLPTEAEWEFAARGGNYSRGYKYAGSNNADEVAWYVNNAGGKTHPVGLLKPNELGLYDMCGNAHEWIMDWYGSYSSEPQINPTGAASGEYRVHRCASWYDPAWYCRVTARRLWLPHNNNNNLGLRLAL